MTSIAKSNVVVVDPLVREPVAVGGRLGRLRERRGRQVARDDLRRALVEELGLDVRLDGHDAGIRGQPRDLGGRQRPVDGSERPGGQRRAPWLALVRARRRRRRPRRS